MHNVLIIDDDRELCLLIKRSVLLEDIEADFCNTGKAGLQKLKEKQYQLVILDVMMPGMDNQHKEGNHYVPGTAIPEPWASMYF